MPRYYFHVQRGSVTSPDMIGLVFPDARVAIKEGERAVRDMLRDARIKGESVADTHLQVIEENGSQIHTFDLAAARDEFV